MSIVRKYLTGVLVFLFTLISFNVSALTSADNRLIKGALTGNIKLVKKAINNGANLNAKESAKGNTALMLAAYYKHSKIVDLLIKSKADVNEVDLAENTALMKAAWTGGVESVRLLLEANADVNAIEVDGMTALMVASFYGHIDVVKLLVEADSNILIKDNDGYTALMNAQDQKHTDIVEYLTKLQEDLITSSVVGELKI